MDAELKRVLDGKQRWTVAHGDCCAVLRTLPDESIDAIVCDPPYGLGSREPTVAEIIAYLSGKPLRTGGDFMGKNWQMPSVAAWRECLRVLKPGGHALVFAGTRTWDLIALGLRAAGFQMRDTIADEHPSLQWVQGQGFPKSLNVSLAIDEKLGMAAQREVTGTYTAGGNAGTSTADKGGTYVVGAPNSDPVTLTRTRGATPEAREWDGYGTALRPSWEPILVFRKPLVGTVVENVLRYNIGALNIDGCRVATDWNEPDRPESWKRSGYTADADAEKIAAPPGAGIECHPGGRWPANVVFTHGWPDLCRDDADLCYDVACALNERSIRDSLSGCPSCLRSCGAHLRQLAVSALDGAPSPDDVRELCDRLASELARSPGCQSSGQRSCGDSDRASPEPGSAQSRSASACRFSESSEFGSGSDHILRSEPALLSSRDGSAPSRTLASIDRTETAYCTACRDAAVHLLNSACHELLFGSRLQYITSCPVRALEEQSGERTSGALSPANNVQPSTGWSGGSSADRVKSVFESNTGTAVRFFPCFLYEPKASPAEREAGLADHPVRNGAELTDSKEGQARLDSPRTGAGRGGGRRNAHPTVKPVALMRWLVRLVTRPRSIVLDPFCGSGSTGIACMLEGRRFIGIELFDTDKEPFVRIARARIRYAADNPSAWLEGAIEKPKPSKPGQRTMFDLLEEK